MKKILLILPIIFVFSSPIFAQEESKPEKTEAQPKAEEVSPCFKTDGCTLFPDGNYRDCCVAHDKDYFKGGTGKERAASDKRLYKCVKSKKGWQNKLIAPLMWVGVRIGGVSFLPTPFRWGFGKRKKFQRCRKKLKESKKQVKPTSGKVTNQN